MNTRYELNMDVPPREAIRLMYVSKSRFGGDWNSVPHTHSCTEVFYCVDGRGQFNVEGKMLDVAPDDMVIVNPRTLHTELSYQACPLEYIVLGIEGVEILFNQRDQGYTMVKCGAMREDMLGLTKMLLREIWPTFPSVSARSRTSAPTNTAKPPPAKPLRAICKGAQCSPSWRAANGRPYTFSRSKM